jgi:hypothetical protein
VFDKKFLTDDPTLEWVTPGHPLFESVREDVFERVQTDLRNGAIFYDLHRKEPARLDVFSAAIRDGRGNVLHRRLFVVETGINAIMTVRQPTIFLDFSLAPGKNSGWQRVARPGPGRTILIEQALQPFWKFKASAKKKRRLSPGI